MKDTGFIQLTVQKFLQGIERALEVVSAKSSLGHAEAGAGTLGILRAVTRLQTQSVACLTHLRVLNPHVLNILETNLDKFPAVLPRQVAGVSAIGPMCSGISGFAFQVCITLIIFPSTHRWCSHQ